MMKIKYIGLLVISLFFVSSIGSLSAANTFSGFVDDDHMYVGFVNWWSEWTVEQYDHWGVRHLNTPWMKKHKEIDGLGTYDGNRILFRYGQYINTWIVGNHRSVSLSLSLYNYHGGEISVKPVQTSHYPTDWNVFINGKLYDTVHAEGDEKTIGLILYY